MARCHRIGQQNEVTVYRLVTRDTYKHTNMYYYCILSYLQAMARCHRIGQQKEVTVYRLVTRDTYEEHLFQTASRKYGECVLRRNLIVFAY